MSGRVGVSSVPSDMQVARMFGTWVMPTLSAMPNGPCLEYVIARQQSIQTQTQKLTTLAELLNCQTLERRSVGIWRLLVRTYR
jgi:hypothetical protein